MPQNALRKTMFPLGTLIKSDVKEIAKTHNLNRIARKRESTGICFVGKRNFQDFIADYIKPQTGKFIDIDTGKVIGNHDGLHNWTVGQGCKISGCLNAYFIARKCTSSNDIFVAAGTNNPALFTDVVYTDAPHWIESKSPFSSNLIINCQFRFQHTKPLVDCKMFQSRTSNLFIKLKTPLRALTPGQYAVFYKGDECLGSAKILAPGPSLNFQILKSS